MTRGTKILLTASVGAVLLAAATVTLTAAAVYRAGSVSVRVQDGGDEFSLRLPAALAHIALSLAPSSALAEVDAELRPFLPAIEAGLRELEAADDFVLVEIDSRDERVLIEKRGESLRIVARDGGHEVSVSLPLSTASHVCRRLRGNRRQAA